MVRWTWAIFHAQVLLSCNSSRFLFNKKTPGFTSLALGLAPEFEGYATVHWLCVATCYSALGAAPAATLSLRPAQAACVARSRIGASESQGKATTFGGGLWASHQLLGILQNFSFLEVRHTCLEGVAFVCFCCILSFLVAKNDPPQKKINPRKKKRNRTVFIIIQSVFKLLLVSFLPMVLHPNRSPPFLLRLLVVLRLSPLLNLCRSCSGAGRRIGSSKVGRHP